MKLSIAVVLAAVLAGSPASARAPESVQLRILPLAHDREAGTVTIWVQDLYTLVHLASRKCEVY